MVSSFSTTAQKCTSLSIFVKTARRSLDDLRPRRGDAHDRKPTLAGAVLAEAEQPESGQGEHRAGSGTTQALVDRHNQVGPTREHEAGGLIGERGREFGTVTGRKRRCGWFDATLVRQTIKVCGIDGIALTKLDILDGFETIKIGVGYKLDGQTIDYFPASQGAQARVEPIYEEFEGWSGSTAGARSWADLPAQAVKYVRRIEELIGAPVAVLSTSPERDDTILMKNPFEG